MKNNYLKKQLLFALVVSGSMGFAQNYTWMKGSNATDQPGIYGTMGVAAAANNPGAREVPASWKDASGNFWVMGGFGDDALGNQGLMDDLWKYNIASNQWTWMNGDNTADENGVYGTMGTAAATNKPGGREGAGSWVDASGNFWLFGGIAIDAGSTLAEINDLWKYNIATNQWTWMKGSNFSQQNGTYGTLGTAAAANTPGARIFPVTWTDAGGNFWLFGGTGYDAVGNYGDLNDLWRFNTSTNQWTWIKGANTADQNGIYGTMGVAAAGNAPGARYLSGSWADASGNLWLFGGAGFDANTGVEDMLNDVWRYNIASNQWTWMKGSTVSAQPGIYGTQGTAAAANTPGSRGGLSSWTDASGNYVMFGGFGYDNTGSQDILNDLWKYNVSTNQWTWIRGSNSVSANGVYGTQGIPAATNEPGARGGAPAWKDAAGNFWLFGGAGYDAIGTAENDLNDLWRFSNCISNPTLLVASTATAACLGSTVTYTASGASMYTWSTSQTGAVISITPAAAGISNFTCTGFDLSGCMSAVTLTLNGLATPSVNATTSKATSCKGQTVTLTATGASTYTWNTTPSYTTAAVVVSPTITTSYMVTGTGANGCSATYSITQVVALCTGIESQDASANVYNVYPNPNNGAFSIESPGFAPGTTLVIYNTLGQKVREETLTAVQTNIQVQLPTGLYQYNVMQQNKKIGSGKLVIKE